MRTVAVAVVCLTACLLWTEGRPAANAPSSGQRELTTLDSAENEVLPRVAGGPDLADDAARALEPRARLPLTRGSWDWVRWPLAYTTTEYSSAVRPLARRRGCLSQQGHVGARASSSEQPDQGDADGEEHGGPERAPWSAYWTPREQEARAEVLPVHRGSSIGGKVLYKGVAAPRSAVDPSPVKFSLSMPTAAAESVAVNPIGDPDVENVLQ